MHNRVQIALARRERLRKARDKAWMVLAALAVVAVIGVVGVVMLVRRLGTGAPVAHWVELGFFAVLAIVAGLLAVRALGVARRLTRRLEETNPMETPLGDERPISIWDEVLRGPR